jgi:uncharacterized protein with HEPN domain
MPSDRRRRWLDDIVANCDRIARYIKGMDRAAYVADEKTIDAVERCLQRICEAAVRLGQDEDRSLEERHPEVDWRAVRRMGNILRHKYDDLDDELIWAAITTKLSPLRTAAKRESARLARLKR